MDRKAEEEPIVGLSATTTTPRAARRRTRSRLKTDRSCPSPFPGGSTRAPRSPPGLAGQRLDGVGHVREPEAVRVQPLQWETARLDDPDRVRVAPGVDAEGPDDGGPLVDDQVGVDRM